MYCYAVAALADYGHQEHSGVRVGGIGIGRIIPLFQASVHSNHYASSGAFSANFWSPFSFRRSHMQTLLLCRSPAICALLPRGQEDFLDICKLCRTFDKGNVDCVF